MYTIEKNESKIALRILTTAFADNPALLEIVRNDTKVKERLEVLCNHCLTISILKKGAFITSDKKGIALIFRSDLKLNLIQIIKNYFILGQYCIGWNRSLEMIRRESEIRKRRPKNQHLYFWMLAVEDHTNGLNTIIEIRDFVFNYSKQTKLDIYAETTVEVTLTLYKRYGFVVYDKWERKNHADVYFIRRPWNV